MTGLGAGFLWFIIYTSYGVAFWYKIHQIVIWNLSGFHYLLRQLAYEVLGGIFLIVRKIGKLF
jgi:hypothetical protein